MRQLGTITGAAMVLATLSWPSALAETKDQSRLAGDEPGVLAQSAEPVPEPQQPLPPVPDTTEPTAEEEPPPDDISLGEIPLIETIELTPDIAKRALDSYLLVKEKYKDAELENYENFQDFVDKAEQGKAFEADIKAAGFANVNDWNLAITTLGYAYSGTIDDQSADIKQQIEELKTDTEIAQDMRERMIASLNALVPSENNRTIIKALMADPAYSEKLKHLETETETEAE
jgi:hypothetical protein